MTVQWNYFFEGLFFLITVFNKEFCRSVNETLNLCSGVKTKWIVLLYVFKPFSLTVVDTLDCCLVVLIIQKFGLMRSEH